MKSGVKVLIEGFMTYVVPNVGNIASVGLALAAWCERPSNGTFGYWWSGVLAITLIVVVVSAFATFYRQSNRSKDLLEASSNGFHDVAHEIRNRYVSLARDTRSNNQLKCEEMGTGADAPPTCPLRRKQQSIKDLFNDHIKETGGVVVQRVADILTAWTGVRCRASLRLIADPTQPSPPDIAKYITIARDKCSRLTQDYDSIAIPLERCTPLWEIVRPRKSFGERRKSYFFDTNLPSNVDNYDSFTHPNPDWKQHHVSVLIVPIRVEVDRLSLDKRQKFPKGTTHDILGFIWCNSVRAEAFDPKLEEHYVWLVYAIADEMYHLLQAVTDCAEPQYDTGISTKQSFTA